MALLVVACKKCRKEVQLDPLALLEGKAISVVDCGCGFLARQVATLEAVAIRASESLGETPIFDT